MQLYEGLQRAPRPPAGSELHVREALRRGQNFEAPDSPHDWRADQGVREANSLTPIATAQALRTATAALPECLDPVLSEARLWTGVPATFLLSVLTNGATAPPAPGAAQPAAQHRMPVVREQARSPWTSAARRA